MWSDICLHANVIFFEKGIAFRQRGSRKNSSVEKQTMYRNTNIRAYFKSETEAIAFVILRIFLHSLKNWLIRFARANAYYFWGAFLILNTCIIFSGSFKSVPTITITITITITTTTTIAITITVTITMITHLREKLFSMSRLVRFENVV